MNALKLSQELREVKENNPSLTGKVARKIARRRVKRNTEYTPGTLGSSKVSGLKSRKVRRENAQKTNKKFLPHYNGERIRVEKKLNEKTGDIVVSYRPYKKQKVKK
jgi:hypothetical protein